MSKFDTTKAMSYASSYGQGPKELQGSVWTRRRGKRYIFEVGLGCQLVALITLFIAFVSPYWIVSWPRVYSGFKRIGLWEACFAGLVLETDRSTKAYHGCWWILAPEFWEIRGWLMPGWFIFTQVAVTLCLVAEAVGFIINFLIWLKTGGKQKDGQYKQKESICCLAISTWITIISTVLMVGSTVTFVVAFSVDKFWLPNPYFNYLNWSFGMAVVSAFFSAFTLICHVTYVMIVHEEAKRPPPAVSMSGTLERTIDSSI